VHRSEGGFWRPFSIVGLFLALVLGECGTTIAAENALAIELNRLEDVNGGCRLSFVLTNELAVSIDGLSIEAVLFDPEGRVDRFLLLKAKPLPQGRARVQQFDVGETTCARIGRVLLNDVTDCAGEGLSPAACMEAIRPESRAEVPFSTALAPTRAK
jgi:hypothetical protein